MKISKKIKLFLKILLKNPKILSLLLLLFLCALTTYVLGNPDTTTLNADGDKGWPTPDPDPFP
ncbi:MAG: hypothetical protein J7L38_02880 [Thermoproteales archaeon]|nr:hypothetical protein [Thermoproteales archaeon]RLE65821.1 MAG: hypothetical protein DRJ47_04090 [Thermoprotei archaeon]